MPNKKNNTKKLPQLDLKIRTYLLTSNSSPISFQLRSRHTRYNPLLWFNGEVQKALRYCSNQTSIFADEQDDNAILDAIIFEDGKLVVPAEDRLLQLFLEIHPDNGRVFTEFDPEQDAQKEYEDELRSVDAASTARDLDITELEAIARVIYRGKVDKMTSAEIKRDMLLYAKRNPDRFMELADDPNIKLRNLAIRAMDMNILGLKDDGRTVVFKETGDKILTVGFGENVYSALASYFQTDEGMDLMQNISMSLS